MRYCNPVFGIPADGRRRKRSRHERQRADAGNRPADHSSHNGWYNIRSESHSRAAASMLQPSDSDYGNIPNSQESSKRRRMAQVPSGSEPRHIHDSCSPMPSNRQSRRNQDLEQR